MFDPITEKLIRSAPPLEGLDLDGVPKKLTSAFARIVAARILMRRRSRSGDEIGVIDELDELRRIAAAYESYAALLPDRTNRGAAAFVAASAQRACSLSLGSGSAASRISIASISSEVCSTLLFLIAEAHADAAEAAKRIAINDDHGTPSERALLRAIKNLAQGRLFDIVRADIPAIEYSEDNAEDLAVDALIMLLLRGVRKLARQLTLRPSATVDGGINHFAQVKELCIERIDGLGAPEGRVVSIFPGPLHLANLLITLEGDLLSSATTRVPAPGGTLADSWWQVIRKLARQRPYLWRNHRQAIDSGYLERGISSAISFPTGGGKSTLAELKIAATLLRGEKVIFLAPTHALVSQTISALKRTFEKFEIIGEIEDEVSFGDLDVLPEVTVATPEQCLMLLSMNREAFDGLGLVIFDECHLLHPRDGDRSHRGLDAMLTLLNLRNAAPGADFLLLSAMMKNTAEIAGWIASFTGRHCLSLDLSWKPTRQVRGCVVYQTEQIDILKAKLAAARLERPSQRAVPAAIKRELRARPFGLFGLLQTWTREREDYALLPLLEGDELLGANTGSGRWYPTPNGNNTSGAIAAAAVASGMKTLVFLQSTVFCESCVRDFSSRLNVPEVHLLDEEASLFALSVEEMGGADYCYLQIDADGVLRAGAASHHSLLLREERELHEGLFKRADGINVLFATSTLAQGMNLPSEIVIISGDSRFDADADRMKQMEAYELLNAAGRAGRAGEGAHGFVLLVPSRVIEFDDEAGKISKYWMDLQSIFEQADQCLVIDDPIEGILDNIHAGLQTGSLASYFLSKLPGPGSEGDVADGLLRGSLAAYRARLARKEAWLDSRIASALAARNVVELPTDEKWIEQFASSSGVSVDILKNMLNLADGGYFEGNAYEVMEALLAWIKKNPALMFKFIRPENIEGLFGERYKELTSDVERCEMALPMISKLLPIWMSGAPLCKIEAAYLGRDDRLGKCEYARHFAARIVPDLAFLAGLPARLLGGRSKMSGDVVAIRTVLVTLGSIVREGCDSPEALAVRLNEGRSVSRVAARATYEAIAATEILGVAIEDFDMTRQRMRKAKLERDVDEAFS